jgi:hypothetical protein
MAEEQPKQARKVRDLKARLGRTIAPGTRAPGAPSGDVVAPPNLGDAPVPPPANIAPQQSVIGGPSVVAPPFMQKKRQKASDDPFAAGEEAQTGPREVRLVFDDSAVADSEVGRQSRRGLILAIAVSAVVSIVVGYGVGSSMGGRRMHNSAIQAAGRIHEAVQSAEPALEEVRTHVDSAMAAVRGGPGKAPRVDYEAVLSLRGIANPFETAQFTQENYTQFNPNATDALFTFYMKTKELFGQIRVLAARAQTRREELDQAEAAANSLTTDQTGCIPVIENQRILCGLVFVEPPPPPAEGEAPSNMLKVRSTKGGRPAEREIYTGQSIVENPDKFVILTNTSTSIGVLGQRATAFAEYSRDLAQLKETLDAIDEARGRLRGELDRIRALDELFAF